MRTRQASAKLIRMSEYFSISLTIGAAFSEKFKATNTARRRSKALIVAGPPRPSYVLSRVVVFGFSAFPDCDHILHLGASKPELLGTIEYTARKVSPGHRECDRSQRVRRRTSFRYVIAQQNPEW